MSSVSRYLAEDERLVRVVRRHWTDVLGCFAVLAAIVAVAGALLWLLSARQEQWSVWASYVVVGIAALAALVYWLAPLLSWWNTRYLLTDRRLLHRYGVLTRHGRDVPLARISDVSSSATLADRLLGRGTLSVGTDSEQEELVLDRIPSVELFQSDLHRLVDAENRRSASASDESDRSDTGG
ncbi:PH domain-containing protein [Salinactinospora qingdaonensis]|uniref:PH domain-containing protein n=1 Tax=Salinactinospora qingdaonensis TaxID=702744 RepID=A0ABP7FY51_9ACTN